MKPPLSESYRDSEKCTSMTKITALFILLILPSVLRSQHNILVLKAAQMLDVSNGSIIKNPVLLIENGIIKEINQKTIPDSIEVIDLGDAMLLPGLIDTHTHLTRDVTSVGFRVNPNSLGAGALYALIGAKNARLTLQAGFTTVRDLGSMELSDIALSKAIDAGFVEGPQIIPAGYAISITGGHTDASGFGAGSTLIGVEKGAADGASELLKAVRFQIKHGAKVIKIAATAGVFSNEKTNAAQQFTYEEMKIVVEEAKRHGLKVAAHAHGTAGIIAASNAGVSSIEHASILTDEAINVIKKNKTYIVPTAYIVDGMNLNVVPQTIRDKATTLFPKMKESHRKAIAAGVKIAFGTDAAVIPHGQNGKEFSSLVDLGMTNLAAIQAATVNAADLLDTKDRGKLAIGFRADIIAVKGNPLHDVSVLQNVVFVMKLGKVHKNISK